MHFSQLPPDLKQFLLYTFGSRNYATSDSASAFLSGFMMGRGYTSCAIGSVRWKDTPPWAYVCNMGREWMWGCGMPEDDMSIFYVTCLIY